MRAADLPLKGPALGAALRRLEARWLASGLRLDAAALAARGRWLTSTQFRRARRLATGSLLALVAVFLATHLVGGDSGWLALVQAMAEAGMVGGLADWFAVEALFRRPLGLPIPHTALLPSNQARAARNVGRFFEAHFLEPAALEERLRRVEIGRHAADWLARPGNALALARRLVALVAGVARHDPPPRVLARARAWLRATALSAGGDAAVAEALAGGVKQGVRGTLVDEAFGLIRRTIDENREVAVQLVQDRSRWWIAGHRRPAGGGGWRSPACCRCSTSCAPRTPTCAAASRPRSTG